MINPLRQPAPQRLILGIAFVGVMVFLVFLAFSDTVGNGTAAASPPDLSTSAGALSALVLGLLINPGEKPQAGSGTYVPYQTFFWTVFVLGSFVVASLAAAQVFNSAHHAAGVALTAALAAFGGLFVDSSGVTHPKGDG